MLKLMQIFILQKCQDIFLTVKEPTQRYHRKGQGMRGG